MAGVDDAGGGVARQLARLPPGLFAYARCAKGGGGGLAVVAINPFNTTAKFDVRFPGASPSSARQDYVLTAAGAAVAQPVACNGKVLATAADIAPQAAEGPSVPMPPLSIVFSTFAAAGLGRVCSGPNRSHV